MVHVSSHSGGAEYDVTPEFAINGTAGQTIFDFSDLRAPADCTATGLTLGASQDISNVASIPMFLSAEYSRTVLDLDVLLPGLEPEIDRSVLGLTIAIGNGSGSALNSDTRIARGRYRTAVAAAFNSY